MNSFNIDKILKEIIILFVDDDSGIRNMMKEIFKKLNIQYELAENGMIALEKYKKNKYNIIYTDIKMPELNGIELIKKIKEQDPYQCIIASSGFNDQKRFIQLINLSVSAFIPKPTDFYTIKTVIENVARIDFLLNQNKQFAKKLLQNVEEKTKKIKENHLRLKNMEDVLINSKIYTLIFRREPKYKLLLTIKNNIWFGYSLEDFFSNGFINTALCINNDIDLQKKKLHNFFNNDENKINFKVNINNKNSTSSIWLKIQYNKIKKLNNSLITYQVVCSNITDEINKEHQIKKFSEIIKQISLGIVITNEDGFITYINEAFTYLFNLKNKNLIGKELFEVLNFKDEKEKMNLLNDLFSNLNYSSENRILVDSNIKWFRIIALPVKNEIGVFSKQYAISFQDITPNKNTAINIEKNEIKYRRIFNNIHDIYMEVNADGIITEVAPSIKEITGLKREETLNKQFSTFFSSKDDFNSFYKTLITTNVVDNFETSINIYNNKKLSVLVTARLSNNHASEKQNYSVMFKDVTQKKRYEKSLIAMNEDFKRKNIELKRMQDYLVQQEKMASIGQLAAGIAHEINNPTGYVMSNLRSFKDYVKDLEEYFKVESNLLKTIEENSNNKQIKEELSKLLNIKDEIDLEFILEDLPQLLDESLTGTDKIKEIVQNLKNFARQDMLNEIVEANVNEILDNSLKLVSNELKYNCEIEKNYGNIDAIMCFPNQLSQVFSNMFVNASHAIKDKFKNDMGKIKIETFTQEKSVVIIISDNGKGISQENINKIYDPFFTTKEVGKGTGLGLNISYDIIVNKHKGQIHCESVEDDHTSFIIELPKTEVANV